MVCNKKCPLDIYSYFSGVLKRVDVDAGFWGHVYRSEIKALEVKEVSKGRSIHREESRRPMIKAIPQGGGGI